MIMRRVTSKAQHMVYHYNYYNEGWNLISRRRQPGFLNLWHWGETSNNLRAAVPFVVIY